LIERMRLGFHVLSVMREGCLVSDAKNRILYVNPRYEEITGYSLEEVKGKNPCISNSGRQDREFYKNLWRSLKDNDFREG